MLKDNSDSESLNSLRKSYELGKLDDETLNTDPFVLFKQWMDEAINSDLLEPNAMALATVSKAGNPSLRYVLLKSFDERGLYFFTNYKSPKAVEILTNANVAASFFWASLERQLRVEGSAIKTSEKVSDDYFSTRPRISQLSALSSNQSSNVQSRKELENDFNEIKEKYEGIEIPRPPYWGGYLIIPKSFEFWQGRPGRLHDRIKFKKVGNKWESSRLAP